MQQEFVEGSGRLKAGEEEIEISFRVPAGRCAAEALLPDVQRLANQVVDLAESEAVASGKKVSCAKGCGACCRQMVPISPTEARHLNRLVEEMPAERREAVRARFAEARQRLAQADLPSRGHPQFDKQTYREFGLATFRQGVACPFLEDESCSIHPDRPLVCREYLVTSPAEFCAILGSGSVRQLPVALNVWSAFGRSQAPDGVLEWMPLTEALAFAEEHPNPPTDRTGPERVESLLREIKP